MMLGLGVSYSNLMTSSLSTLSPEELSDGNALVNTSQQFIGAIATALVANILSVFQHAQGFKEGTQFGTSVILVIFFVLVILGLFASYSALKNKKN